MVVSVVDVKINVEFVFIIIENFVVVVVVFFVYSRTIL